MDYIVNRYLSNEEKYIREEVFVKEQGFEEEFDSLEESSYHLLISLDNKIIGCSRFYEIEPNIYKIGRIAILKEYRKKNLGTKMLEYAFNYLKSLNCHTLIVHSQLQAKEFYSKLGFKEHGDIFYEENHPHIEMIKKL